MGEMSQSNRTKIFHSSTLFLLRLRLKKNKQKTRFCQMRRRMKKKMKKSCRKMKSKMNKRNSREIVSRLEIKHRLTLYFIKSKTITNVKHIRLLVRACQLRNILVKNKHQNSLNSRIKLRKTLGFCSQPKMMHHCRPLILSKKSLKGKAKKIQASIEILLIK